MLPLWCPRCFDIFFFKFKKKIGCTVKFLSCIFQLRNVVTENDARAMLDDELTLDLFQRCGITTLLNVSLPYVIIKRIDYIV